jgi:hypothetical protein
MGVIGGITHRQDREISACRGSGRPVHQAATLPTRLSDVGVSSRPTGSW